MRETQLIAMIVGMFAATFPIRYLPLVVFSRVKAPQVFRVWLGYIPIAVFSAMIVQTLFGGVETSISWPTLVGCVLTIVVTTKMKSMGWGIAVGFGVYLVVNLCLL